MNSSAALEKGATPHKEIKPIMNVIRTNNIGEKAEPMISGTFLLQDNSVSLNISQEKEWEDRSKNPRGRDKEYSSGMQLR